jgi:hypothetical protein
METMAKSSQWQTKYDMGEIQSSVETLSIAHSKNCSLYSQKENNMNITRVVTRTTQ